MEGFRLKEEKHHKRRMQHFSDVCGSLALLQLLQARHTAVNIMFQYFWNSSPKLLSAFYLTFDSLNVLSCLLLHPRCKYQETKAEILIYNLLFIFCSQTQMSSVHHKKKEKIVLKKGNLSLAKVNDVL